MANKEVLNEVKSIRFTCFNNLIDNNIPIEINRVEKMVLISLIRHNNWKTGICNPTIKTIQNEWFYKSDREVIEALKSLKEKKLFIKQTIKRRNYYQLNIDLLLNDYPQNVGNLQNEGNIQNVGNNTPQNVGNNTPQNEGTNIKETEKEHKNMYSSLKSETYVDNIDKKLEEDLLNKINNKYSKDCIKEELSKLKNKSLSNLDLLIELEKNLKSKKKEIIVECSNDIKLIFDCWNDKEIIKHKNLSPVIKKSIEKALKIYKAEEIVQAINVYSDVLHSTYYFSYKWSLSDFLSRKNGISTFMEEGSNKANYEAWKKGDSKNGNTTKHITKDRGRFNEGTENFKFKGTPTEVRSYTQEEIERAGLK
ncbi:helix-turn-helix domain-containing protein [Clostridium sp.]|uniref:helix-turn-helix domain-containing protein n=1 Tax=Clostridium sp. TaxID=1506 RepID=UPI002FC8EE05